MVAVWFREDAVGVAEWLCDDGLAVTTLFFDATERPTVRLEVGDRIHTGMLSPTGSGARYDGDFGRWIWIEGDAATYREADPEGTEHACRRAGA